MSAARLSDEDREWLTKSCAESGVPVVVTDPQVLLDTADILRGTNLRESTVDGRAA